MDYLLYLMFRCDGDVMESLDLGGGLRELNTPQHKPKAAQVTISGLGTTKPSLMIPLALLKNPIVVS